MKRQTIGRKARTKQAKLELKAVPEISPINDIDNLIAYQKHLPNRQSGTHILLGSNKTNQEMWQVQAHRQEKPQRPHHPIVVQKKTHYEFDYQCACGICKHSISIPFQFLVFISHTDSPRNLHFIPLSFIAYSSAPHGLGSSLISTPQAPFIRSLPKPFSNANPMVYFFYCGEFYPIETPTGER